MEYAICLLSVVPVRAEPNDRSEMVNQLLFGELMEIVDERHEWMQIRGCYDGYHGWIDNKQCTRIDNKDYVLIRQMDQHMVSDMVAEATDETGRKMLLVAGSFLPGLNNGYLKLPGKNFRYQGTSVSWSKQRSGDDIIRIAAMFEGVPYLWGGRSPFGLDCSGFTQIVYRLAGIVLERDAHRQAMQGIPLSFITEAQPGDLAFFDNDEGQIIHVGIVATEGKIIHASGQVCMDLLDHQGIYSREKHQYTHTLRLIRHLL